MPRVQTIVPTEPIESAETPTAPASPGQFVRLRADQVRIDPVIAKARSGPPPANEQKKIEALALSMRTVGQLVPLIVEPAAPDDDIRYRLVDGWRRVQAARHINQTVDPGFELVCIVRENGSDPLRAAVHANLKRRGLSPLQFAHLCRELRVMRGWKGTRELADYLQVSRASISQHDKLLAKPKGMSDPAYRDLLDKVSNGRMGAEAAFELLTHVEPTKAGKVLERAVEKAGQETAGEAVQEPAPPSTTTPEPETPPEAPGRRQSASQRKTGTRTKSAKSITRAHIREAARETGAIVRPTSKGLPELRKLFGQMRAVAYPDVMRSFVSLLAEQWWRGDCKDKDVLAHWEQIAAIVRQAENGKNSNRRKH